MQNLAVRKCCFIYQRLPALQSLLQELVADFTAMTLWSSANLLIAADLKLQNIRIVAFINFLVDASIAAKPFLQNALNIHARDTGIGVQNFICRATLEELRQHPWLHSEAGKKQRRVQQPIQSHQKTATVMMPPSPVTMVITLDLKNSK